VDRLHKTDEIQFHTTVKKKANCHAHCHIDMVIWHYKDPDLFPLKILIVPIFYCRKYHQKARRNHEVHPSDFHVELLSSCHWLVLVMSGSHCLLTPLMTSVITIQMNGKPMENSLFIICTVGKENTSFSKSQQLHLTSPINKRGEILLHTIRFKFR
jgi:hypothetical protein